MIKWILILSIGFLIWASLAFAIDYDATQIENYESEIRNTGRIALGDINGDEYIDIFEPNGVNQDNGEGNILYIYNPAQGAYEPRHVDLETDLSLQPSRAATLMDFNNDGILDVAVANQDTNEVIYYFTMNGEYLQVGKQYLSSDDKTALGIASGDINKDGFYDIVVANTDMVPFSGDINSIYWNNGDGTFTLEYFGGQKYSVDIELGDLNNDGWLDVVTANQYDGIDVYFYKPNEGYVEEASWTWTGNTTNDDKLRSVELADFNNDGQMDIVASANRSSNSYDNIFLFRNNGDKTLVLINQFKCYSSTGRLDVEDIDVVDLNNDGLIDIVAGQKDYNPNDANIIQDKYHINTTIPGSGYFTFDNRCNTIDGIYSNSLTYGIRAADIDNDDDIDIVTGSIIYGSDTYQYNYIYENTETTNNAKPTPPDSLWMTYENEVWHLHWSTGSDTLLPDSLLTYNLRFGTAADSNKVISGIVEVGPGVYNRIHTFAIEDALLEGKTDYYWGVQSVDNAWRRSQWATYFWKRNEIPFIDPLPDIAINENGFDNSIILNENVSDADDDISELIWTYEVSPDETGVTVMINENDNNRVTITPDANWWGEKDITFRVTDPAGKYDTETIHLTINDRPIIQNFPNPINFDEDFTYTLFNLDNYCGDGDHALPDLIWSAEVLDGTELIVTVNNDSDKVTFQTTPHWNGTNTVQFSLRDPFDEIIDDTVNISVIVRSINDPPALPDTLPTRNTNEDYPIFITLKAYLELEENEDTGDSYFWEAQDNDFVNVSINQASSRATIIPESDWYGQTTLYFTVTDSANSSDNTEMVLNIMSIPDAPKVSDIPALVILEEETATIPLYQYLSDADPEDSHTWQRIGGSTIDVVIPDSIAYVTGQENWNGTQLMTFKVVDMYNLYDTDTVHVQILPVNDPPVWTLPETMTYNEDETNYIDMNDYVDDPDIGDNFIWGNVIGAQNLNANLNGNGVLTLTPNLNWHGHEELTFTVIDSAGQSDTTSVIFIIEAVNDPPEITTPDTISVPENESVTFIMGNYINDPDVGDQFQCDITGNDNLSIQFIDECVYYIEPDFNWSGLDTLTLSVTDTGNITVTKDVIFMIGNINDPPTLTLPNAITVDEDTTPCIDLNTYIQDPDVDDIFQCNITGHQGVLAMSQDGNCNYCFTPPDNWCGEVELTATVTDTGNASDSQTFWLRFSCVNDPPQWNLPIGFTMNEDEAKTINLYDYFDDPDVGDIHQFNVSGYLHTLPEVDQNGNLTITPQLDWYGNETLTLTVSDSANAIDEQQVVFTIQNENDPPEITFPNPMVYQEDETVQIILDDYVNDADLEDIFQWEVTSSAHLTTQIQNGILTINPTANWVGVEALSFTVTDTATASANENIWFIFNSVNDPPMWVGLPDSLIFDENEQSTLDLNYYVDDPDLGDVHSWDITSGQNIDVQINIFGLLTVTPDADWSGSENFTLTVSDTVNASDVINLKFIISDTPYPPVLTFPDSFVYDEDQMPQIDLNDYIYDPNLDTDFDWAITGNQNIGVQVDASGILSLAPVSHWNGRETLTITATDTTNQWDAEEVIFVFNSVNDAPTINGLPQSLEINEDGSTTFNLGNYIDDPDIGDVVQCQIADNQNLNIQETDECTFTIEPIADWHGTEFLILTVSDTANATANANLTVIVSNINDEPELSLPDSLIYAEEEIVQFDLMPYLADPDSSETFLWQITGQIELNAQINPDGLLNVTSPQNWNGRELLTITVSDGSITSAPDNIWLIFTPVNDPPVWTLPDTLAFGESGESTLNLNTYVNDPDENDIYTWDITGGTQISAIIDGNGILHVDPQDNWQGNESFVLTVTDTANASDVKTVEFVITDVNFPPSITLPDSMIYNEDQVVQIDLNDYVEDANINEVHQWEVSDGTQILSEITENNILTMNPQSNWNGRELLTFTVSDSGNETDSKDVWMIFKSVNDPPQWIGTPDSIAIFEEGSHVLSLGEYMNDIDEGDVLQCTISGYNNMNIQPVGGDWVFLIIPYPNWYGTENLTITITDTANTTADETILFTVKNTNDPPALNLPFYFSCMEDSSCTYDLNDYIDDPDLEDVYQWEITGYENITPEIDENNMLTITPTPNFDEGEKLFFTITDTGGLSAEDKTWFIFTPVNDAPVLSLADTIEAYEYITFEQSIVAIDPDGDSLSFDVSYVALPDTSESINFETTAFADSIVISFEPDSTHTGYHQFYVTVNDGHGQQDEQNLTLYVTQFVDMNGDGIIEIRDVQFLMKYISAPYNYRYDLNRDGAVNTRDLKVLINHIKTNNF